MTSPCATCTRKCCHHYLITVTGYDVWTLATGLHMAPEQFLVAVSQTVHTKWEFRLNPAGPNYHIALDKKPGKGKDRACVFLVELPAGINRCGVYPFRPLVCQTYPAYLHEGNVVRSEDVLCPDDAWRDGVLKRPVWRKQLARQQVERDIYEMVVARWNAYVGDADADAPFPLSLSHFYTYLLDVYGRLADVRARLGDAAWDAQCERWNAADMDRANPLLPDAGVPPALAPTVEEVGAVIHGMLRR